MCNIPTGKIFPGVAMFWFLFTSQ